MDNAVLNGGNRMVDNVIDITQFPFSKKKNEDRAECLKNNSYERMLSDILARNIWYFVDQIIERFCGSNKFVYEELDKETLQLLTDLAFEIVIERIPEFSEFKDNIDGSGMFSKRCVLRSLVRQIIISELFNNKESKNVIDCTKAMTAARNIQTQNPTSAEISNNNLSPAGSMLFSPWFY